MQTCVFGHEGDGMDPTRESRDRDRQVWDSFKVPQSPGSAPRDEVINTLTSIQALFRRGTTAEGYLARRNATRYLTQFLRDSTSSSSIKSGLILPAAGFEETTSDMSLLSITDVRRTSKHRSADSMERTNPTCIQHLTQESAFPLFIASCNHRPLTPSSGLSCDGILQTCKKENQTAASSHEVRPGRRQTCIGQGPSSVLRLLCRASHSTISTLSRRYWPGFRD
ncbi:hypothetical protein K456DRAFT_313898 [Colletotrichum gloeosporioides 23]|nr:hypothetical protein K456DRAFT_313898 [Colletotrichum gloeosporioides 23]